MQWVLWRRSDCGGKSDSIKDFVLRGEDTIPPVFPLSPYVREEHGDTPFFCRCDSMVAIIEAVHVPIRLAAHAGHNERLYLIKWGCVE